MTTLDKRYEPVEIADDDDLGSNRSANRPLVEVAARRMARRTVLKGFVSTAIASGLMTSRFALAADGTRPLDFQSPPHKITDDIQLAPGHSADILARWGDPILADAPAFDPQNQTAAAQAGQFGYNCDYLAYFPLPRGSDDSTHGLLHVNHEYTAPELMFPGWTRVDAGQQAEKGKEADAIETASVDAQTPEQSAIEMMAHNGSIIEVVKENGRWKMVPDSEYARRITLDTEMRIAGPAAGHERMRTGYDPTGEKVFGTINNCAGGKTPWGTVLMAEENFHGYFGGGDPENAPEARNHKRYGVKAKARYPWWKSVDRFNLAKEPNEPNRFGWVVEYDPYDPQSVPVKRTALGRFKHEGATSFVNKDGRVVFYSGDDERFDYLYRYVSGGKFDPARGLENGTLLDDGTLYVAKFDEEGLIWLPLVFGQGPLTAENDFESQADVLIETRRAADLLGATPMDRPEDVEPNPVNGRVYVMLTNNSRRKPEQVDAVNPRGPNRHGHVLELIPPGGEGAEADHTAERYQWEILLMAGNPAEPESGARYGEGTDTWFSSPDNCAFDPAGRLWISTDQGSSQAKNDIPDGMYACELEGPRRGDVKFFFACPRGAEMCGPEFTPDGSTLFVAVQHPAESGDMSSTFETPSTRWPDFAEGMPPRPSVVAITRDDGGMIGG
ncbi:PhoX family phosphatase [Geminicoccaceae bacterium 1502E]|nr:PhoX family phosphatase [Geminicoccaceae bacterium 1502E]